LGGGPQPVAVKWWGKDEIGTLTKIYGKLGYVEFTPDRRAHSR
jgi:hypothetical protein